MMMCTAARSSHSLLSALSDAQLCTAMSKGVVGMRGASLCGCKLVQMGPSLLGDLPQRRNCNAKLMRSSVESRGGLGVGFFLRERGQFVACKNGHINAVRLLLNEGAAVMLDRADADGTTPLMAAKHKGHSSIVALLEEHTRRRGGN